MIYQPPAARRAALLVPSRDFSGSLPPSLMSPALERPAGSRISATKFYTQTSSQPPTETAKQLVGWGNRGVAVSLYLWSV